MKLEEGKTYPFQVLKKTTIPEEGEFFMLRHQSGRRLLVPEKHYLNYKIEPGATIECKVDKVSCTGKVYLEPSHPIYCEGKEYLFDLVKDEPAEENQKGRVLVVKDVFDNEIKVLCNNSHPLVKGRISLAVERVRKGIPELYCRCDYEQNALKNLVGSRVQFNINRIDTNPNGDEAYILHSTEGHRAYLKVKHYKSYGFNVGENITCEIYGYTNLGGLKVEPENPFYQIGEVYKFATVPEKNLSKGEEFESGVLTLKDVAGNLCGLEVSQQVKLELNNKTRLKCRVVGFRKGKPKLELTLND